MASPGHRHQVSLEGVIDFSTSTPIFPSDNERTRAEQLFLSLLDHFSTPAISQQHVELCTPFLRLELLRLMYQYAAIGRSKDLFLRAFFANVGVDIGTTATIEQVDLALLPSKIVAFSDFLVDNFFLPLKAASGKTPRATPGTLQIPDAETHQPLSGPRVRLRTLRRDCLIRDKHRCVITRAFDMEETDVRLERDGVHAINDEGQLLSDMDSDEFSYVDVAHILPHSLLDTEGDSPLHVARRNALAILDMFDVGVRYLIEGHNIDRPTNAITLSIEYHQKFGRFKTIFEPTGQPHTYRIESVEDGLPSRRRPLQPITRTLILSENGTIDAPLPRLFAIHAAVARILRMSGAGEYCDNVLRDLDEPEISRDGTTNLGALVSLRLGGWWGGVVA